jgi:hypothetical protein
MPLARAIVAGAIAAVAIPWLARGEDHQFSGWLGRGMVHFAVGSLHLDWSWPLFCVVTLLTWALLAAAANR